MDINIIVPSLLAKNNHYQTIHTLEQLQVASLSNTVMMTKTLQDFEYLGRINHLG